MVDVRSVIGSPSALFLILNLVIATIALTSSRRGRTRRHSLQDQGGGDVGGEHHHHLPALARSSSSNVLERVRSLGCGLFRFRSGDLPAPLPESADLDTTTHHLAPQEEEDLQHRDPADRPQQKAAMRRIRSESEAKKKSEKEAEEEVRKMKKSLSEMTWRRRSAPAAGDPERRPSILRREASVDEEVDAKADDFINRFRQQLRLQRLDSLLRYKDMLTGHNKT